ncbi:MAG TPA: ABC transporter permease, partial [Aggregatilineales bacterium]|nr:ABC transporter permease [Aggregatilineales bacterium]
ETKRTPGGITVNRRRVIDFIGENGFILIFILWCVYLSIATPTFLSMTNLALVFRQSAIVGIVAIGETMIVLLAGIDVSLASILGIAAVAMTWGMVNGVSVLGSPPIMLSAAVAALFGLAVGALIGLVNGLLVTRVKINAVIATLGMMSIIDGIGLTTTGGKTIYGDALKPIDFLASGFVGPVPLMVVIMFVLYAVFWFILNRTTFGAHIYAVGNNERAAYLAGINVDRVKLVTFILAGLLAGFGGLLAASRQGSARAGMGTDLLFPILTAVVLGGVSLSGGRGRILNTLVAAIFLSTITNGLIQLGASTDTQRIISGAILIVALSLDRLRAASS